MSITLAGTQEASVVVFKNLPSESSVVDIEELLRSVHIVSTGIDRKVDSLGQFRGTAFVRFVTPEIARICVDKLSSSQAKLHGRKVKVEMLRQLSRGLSFTAKEILEAGTDADASLTRVRDLITSFVYSNRNETYLPVDLNSAQRKLAHSLAEKFGLVHTTVSPDGEALDASPRHSSNQGAPPSRTVFLSKQRIDGNHRNSITIPRDRARSVASLVTAAVTNDLNKLTPLLPEVPVHAVRTSSNLDRIAIMHATQAQAHAEAAKAALEAAKHARETDAMPDWLEIIEHKAQHPQRPRSKSLLNPNAPEFIPQSKIVSSNDSALLPPPGLV
jgi:hypothetical protein